MERCPVYLIRRWIGRMTLCRRKRAAAREAANVQRWGGVWFGRPRIRALYAGLKIRQLDAGFRWVVRTESRAAPYLFMASVPGATGGVCRRRGDCLTVSVPVPGGKSVLRLTEYLAPARIRMRPAGGDEALFARLRIETAGHAAGAFGVDFYTRFPAGGKEPVAEREKRSCLFRPERYGNTKKTEL